MNKSKKTKKMDVHIYLQANDKKELGYYEIIGDLVHIEDGLILEGKTIVSTKSGKIPPLHVIEEISSMGYNVSSCQSE